MLRIVWFFVLMIVSGICVSDEPYNRLKEFGSWIDADRNCRDTREEVLIRDSLIPVTYKDAKNCKVATGLWVCPYTGHIFTTPKDLDIDHMVPLGEAYISGADKWTPQQRKDYANNLKQTYHLLAVDKSANRSKNDSDPRIWMPPNIAYWKTYLDSWVAVKKQWGLSIDQSEQFMIDANYKTYDLYQKGVLIQPPINACMIR